MRFRSKYRQCQTLWDLQIPLYPLLSPVAQDSCTWPTRYAQTFPEMRNYSSRSQGTLSREGSPLGDPSASLSPRYRTCIDISAGYAVPKWRVVWVKGCRRRRTPGKRCSRCPHLGCEACRYRYSSHRRGMTRLPTMVSRRILGRRDVAGLSHFGVVGAVSDSIV